MILRELYYFDKQTLEPKEDDSFDPTADQSAVEYDDTRKTRLTLSQINKMRKANDFHLDEKNKELVFVRQMYGIAANAETAV